MKRIFLAALVLGMTLTSCKNDKKTQKEELYPETETVANVGYKHKLTWTAFKTPDKIGVEGTFDKIELTGTKDSGDILKDIEGATFNITTSSVNSADPLRDGKLKDGFFGVLNGDINGTFVSFADGKARVEITMNGVNATKDFDYTSDEYSLKINGTIDIINDFKGETAFNSIHELCKDLHLGKTWTDVDIAVEISKR